MVSGMKKVGRSVPPTFRTGGSIDPEVSPVKQLSMEKANRVPCPRRWANTTRCARPSRRPSRCSRGRGRGSSSACWRKAPCGSASRGARRRRRRQDSFRAAQGPRGPRHPRPQRRAGAARARAIHADREGTSLRPGRGGDRAVGPSPRHLRAADARQGGAQAVTRPRQASVGGGSVEGAAHEEAPMAKTRRRAVRKARKVRYAVVGPRPHRAGRGAAGVRARAPQLRARRARLRRRRASCASSAASYGVPSAYGYDELRRAASRSGEVDAVYIALPNHLHREYTDARGRRGRPRPVREADGGHRGGVRGDDPTPRDGAASKLMIAYRLHFEAANLRGASRSCAVGRARRAAPLRLRLHHAGARRATSACSRSRAAGTLYDIGIYCINAARYLFRARADRGVRVRARAAASRASARWTR